ncbi:MAG: LON peptidase substrate-binding domain-containing protein [Pseudomonadota bacterium]
MPFSPYRRITDLPDTIPMFPLSGAILLPRATLPLNVFEPRYLAMLEYVISSNRILGIIQPRTPDDADESPQGDDVPLKNVGCAGRVTGFQELDGGRLAISVTGVVRFRVSSEHSNAEPFRIFSVNYEEFGNDLIANHGEEMVDRGQLLQVLKTYLEARNLQADWQAIEAASTELLVNALSTISPFGPEEKQALLEAGSLQQRAETLATLATMELAADYRSGGGSVQ